MRTVALLALLCVSALTVQGHLKIGYPCTCTLEGDGKLHWGCVSQTGNEIAYTKTSANGKVACKCFDQLSYEAWVKPRGWKESNFVECFQERSHRAGHPCSCSGDGNGGFAWKCHTAADGFPEVAYCKDYAAGKWSEHPHCTCLNPNALGSFPAKGWRPCNENKETQMCVPEVDYYPCGCVDNPDKGVGGWVYGCKVDSGDEPMCEIKNSHRVNQYDLCKCFHGQSSQDWALTLGWDPDNCQDFCIPPQNGRHEPTPCKCLNKGTAQNPQYKYGCGSPQKVPMCVKDHNAIFEGEQCLCWPKSQQTWIEDHTSYSAHTCNDYCMPPYNKKAHYPCGCQMNTPAGQSPYFCNAPGERPFCDDSGERCECIGSPFAGWGAQHVENWSVDFCKNAPDWVCDNFQS